MDRSWRPVFAVEWPRQRFASRLDQSQLSRRRVPQPHQRHTGDLQRPRRTSVHDRLHCSHRRGRGRKRTRDLCRQRQLLRRRDRPAARPDTQFGDARVAGQNACRDRRPRGQERHVQSLPRRDVGPRVFAGQSRIWFRRPGAYAEGIAQPTFFDLYGFYPGSFEGNSSLKPESSRGFELSARYRHDRVQISLTGYRQRLHDEIVDTYDPVTFVSSTANGVGSSRRSGLEAELEWHASRAFRLRANYALLSATQPDSITSGQVKEVRRPKHSGSITMDGVSGPFSYGMAIAYTGARSDTDFDTFPARPVTLRAYWLANARVAYRLSKAVELFVRTNNAFDAHYQDAFGYRTEGRSVYAGIRLAGG